MPYPTIITDQDTFKTFRDEVNSITVYMQATLSQSNLSAIIPPTVNNDSSEGYAIGSLWIDTALDEIYVCLDSSLGAALWQGFSGGILSEDERLNLIHLGAGQSGIFGAGDRNVVIGFLSCEALNDPTSDGNVSIGNLSNRYSIVTRDNIFIGRLSGMGSSGTPPTGLSNIGVGESTLRDRTSASDSIGVGFNAFRFLTSGSQNVAVGSDSGNKIIAGDGNIIIGSNAGPTTDQSNQLFY